MHIKMDDSQSHADLAMQAARRVARARRASQKAKMGHVVCHHLLRMLSDDGRLGVCEQNVGQPFQQVERAKRLEDKQFSLGF